MGGERVLLGITGGIAAYKSADLVRRLREAGAEVRVVMTRGAQEFVTPLTFQAVSGHSVHTELLDPDAEAGMGHIELARWADHVLVAPATAHFLSRLVAGSADDLLTTLCLATRAPVALAPAMNQAMWAHPSTQQNVSTLVERGFEILGPGVGNQACGDEGPGRMLEPPELVEAVLGRGAEPLAGMMVVVTAGPTFEDIDPVRFIANRSSGKMGYSVAQACRQAGAEVILISGPVALDAPDGVERVLVRSAAEMHEAVMVAAPRADVFFGIAAVADWTIAEPSMEKIKKTNGPPRLDLVRTPDIIAEVAKLESRPYIVGFAAETNDLAGYARDKLERKGLDAIAANVVGQEDSGFASDNNELLLIGADGETDLGAGSKRQLAVALVAEIARRLAHRQG